MKIEKTDHNGTTNLEISEKELEIIRDILKEIKKVKIIIKDKDEK